MEARSMTVLTDTAGRIIRKRIDKLTEVVVQAVAEGQLDNGEPLPDVPKSGRPQTAKVGVKHGGGWVRSGKCSYAQI